MQNSMDLVKVNEILKKRKEICIWNSVKRLKNTSFWVFNLKRKICTGKGNVSVIVGGGDIKVVGEFNDLHYFPSVLHTFWPFHTYK